MTPAERELLVAGARTLGVHLVPETIDRLDRFLAVLEVWNRRIHLTGDRDRKILIEKHLVDSLAVVPTLPEAGIAIDIGSGAGFPGIILACVRPDLEVVLIEARRRPTSFLREAVRTIPLARAHVVDCRAEEAAKDPALFGQAAIVTTRAVRLDDFLRLAAPLVAEGGQAIAMQTPRTAGAAASTGAEQGFHLAHRHDYRLPGGERRTLLVFRRTENPAESVS